MWHKEPVLVRSCVYLLFTYRSLGNLKDLVTKVLGVKVDELLLGLAFSAPRFHFKCTCRPFHLRSAAVVDPCTLWIDLGDEEENPFSCLAAGATYDV